MVHAHRCVVKGGSLNSNSEKARITQTDHSLMAASVLQLPESSLQQAVLGLSCLLVTLLIWKCTVGYKIFLQDEHAQQQEQQQADAAPVLDPISQCIKSNDLRMLQILLRELKDRVSSEHATLAPEAAGAAVEVAVTSYNLRALRLLLESGLDAYRTAAAASTACAKPSNGSKQTAALDPATATLLASRKWMEILMNALLQAPDSVQTSIDRWRKEHGSAPKLVPFENLDDTADVLLKGGQTGLQSLVQFWALSGVPVHIEQPCDTVHVSAVQGVVSAWCAVMLNELTKAGASLCAATSCRLGCGEAGWTLLHYTCSAAYGSVQSVHWLLSLQGDADATATAVNNQTAVYLYTPLHLAALAASSTDSSCSAVSVIQLLLQAGADPSLQDVFGRTPADVAVASGDTVAVQTLALHCRDNSAVEAACCSSTTAVLPVNASAQPQGALQRTVDAAASSSSGWHDELVRDTWVSDSAGVLRISVADAAEQQQQQQCSTQAHTELVQLIREGLSLNRPVVVQGLPLGSAKEAWSKAALLKRYGDAHFSVSGIPHSEGYGGPAAVDGVSLAEFIQQWPQTDAAGNTLLYLFSATAAEQLPSLLEDIDLPECMLPFVEAAESFTFYIGPAGSGSPFHEHTAAWNACVWGYKRWCLLPPSAGLTSRKQLQHWLAASTQQQQQQQLQSSDDTSSAATATADTDSSGAAATAAALVGSASGMQNDLPQGCLSFVQGPGDVVFVPPHWTHAVLNLTETVGLASEFSAHQYPPPLPAAMLHSSRAGSAAVVC
jgi:Cupin-like domain/Ankyrin repeat